MKPYFVKTSVGTFRVEKTATHLRVGGKRFCVELKIGTDTSELQWLITKDGGCEIDDVPIHGSATIHLLNLSFTLLKLYTKGTRVTFLDNSKYDCILGNASTVTIFMNKYSYLFYGGTWYDIKVGAIPIDSTQRDMYNKTKTLYTAPLAKSFDFGNPILQKELMPIYEQAASWKEFANVLHARYRTEDLCRKIAPWYSSAVAVLTEFRMLPEYWVIDIKDIALPFTYVQRGGKTRRYTRERNDVTIQSPSELYSLAL